MCNAYYSFVIETKRLNWNLIEMISKIVFKTFGKKMNKIVSEISVAYKQSALCLLC